MIARTEQFDTAAVDRVLSKVDRLHSGPRVAQRLISLTRDPDFDIGQVVECLDHDPALSARVLHVVNSTRYGLSQAVTNVRHASTCLGRNSLRLIVLTFSLVDALSRGKKGQVYSRYARHSFTMATVASRLTRLRPGATNDDSYTAGLLSDVGILVLIQVEGDEYIPLFEQSRNGRELIEAERKTYGFDHSVLGARLLANWEVPAAIVNAVANHHSDDFDGMTALEAAVRAGDLMADVLWNDHSPNVASAKQLLAKNFGIDLDDFIGLAIDCQREIEQSAQLFGVDVRQSLGCDQLRAAAQTLFSEASLGAAIELDSLESAIDELTN